MRARLAVLAAGALLLLAGCHGLPGRVATPAAPALAPGAGNYRIDTPQSRIIVLAWRDGALAALGHNHVIVFTGVRGELLWHGDSAHAAFRVQVPVNEVDIDDPARRTALGADFATAVNDAARVGTRRNMLGERLLDAERFAAVDIDSLGITPQAGGFLVRARLQVHGVVSQVQLPVTLEQGADGSLQVRGSLALKQSALGLTPYSVMMGALRVADTMQLSLELHLLPVRASGESGARS